MFSLEIGVSRLSAWISKLTRLVPCPILSMAESRHSKMNEYTSLPMSTSLSIMSALNVLTAPVSLSLTVKAMGIVLGVSSS